jgi:hypothetical protein
VDFIARSVDKMAASARLGCVLTCAILRKRLLESLCVITLYLKSVNSQFKNILILIWLLDPSALLLQQLTAISDTLGRPARPFGLCRSLRWRAPPSAE